MGHGQLVLISDHASGTLCQSVLTQAEKGWTSRMVQGTGSPSLGPGQLRERGVGARREPCLQRAPAMGPRLCYPSWRRLGLPERRRNASPLQASQYISEIGLQQKLINGYQCHWPGKIKIEDRQVSYAMFLVAVCKGNISFIDFAVWNGNV